MEIENLKSEEYGEQYKEQRTSQVVRNAADEIVKWNTSSIVAAIRK